MVRSKRVVDGVIVRWHGHKLVRCGRGQQPLGVWQNARQQQVITDDGRLRIFYPEGVVTHGYAQVHVQVKKG
jgi:hypothetical protein